MDNAIGKATAAICPFLRREPVLDHSRSATSMTIGFALLPAGQRLTAAAAEAWQAQGREAPNRHDPGEHVD